MKTTLVNQRKEALARRRAAHHAALEKLRGPSCTLTGLQIWRRLRKLEVKASRIATANCNGEAYEGERPKTGEVWKMEIRSKIGQILGREIGAYKEHGIFINTDPRGYALKLDAVNSATVPDGMYTDWGGYGILAPVID
jgi:hypothetical protein